MRLLHDRYFDFKKTVLAISTLGRRQYTLTRAMRIALGINAKSPLKNPCYTFISF